MDGSGYPMVASHDPAVIDAVAPLVGRTGRAADAYEHQMLFGIRDVEQRRLANEDKQVAGVRAVRKSVVRVLHAATGRASLEPAVLPALGGHPGLTGAVADRFPWGRVVVEFRGDDFRRGMDQRGPLRRRSRPRDAARFDAIGEVRLTRPPRTAVVLWLLIAVPSLLQIVVPAILDALERDPI